MTVHREFDQATKAHRKAVAYVQHAGAKLNQPRKSEVPDHDRQLMTQLAQAGTVITPGWLGHALTRAVVEEPLGAAPSDTPLCTRIGECRVDDDSAFPVIINLLGTGHLVIDQDATDHRVAALLQAVTLRLLAARPEGTLSVSLADCVTGGSVFQPFTSLCQADLIPEVATDLKGLMAIVSEAEDHVRHAQRRAEQIADLPERLIVIAGFGVLPPALRNRLNDLAEKGPATRLHLVLAGWGNQSSRPLNYATFMSVTSGRVTVAGVPMPVDVDPAPNVQLIEQVCGQLGKARKWVFGEDPLEY